MTETIPRSTGSRIPWLAALLVPLVAVSWLGCNSAPQDADPSRDILAALRGGLIGFVDPGSASGRHSRVSGWYEPEQKSEGGTFCWTSGRTATLRLDFHEPKDSHIVLRGYCFDDGTGPRTLRVSVNGVEVGEQRVSAQFSTFAFPVPSSSLVLDGNSLELHLDREVRRTNDPRDPQQETRNLGFLVDFVWLRPGPVPTQLPMSDPLEDPLLFVDSGGSIRLPLRDLSSSRLYLSCSSPDTGRLLVSVPEADEFETRIFEFQKTEDSMFVEFPGNMPSLATLELKVESGRVQIHSATLSRPTSRQDVVLIVIDTLRPDYLGCYGSIWGPTPNIDRLAADGILFENALSPIPITAPSHASLMQGVVPSQSGILNNHSAYLSDELPTMAELLSHQGFHCEAVVSLDPLIGRVGFDRGFDNYDDRMGLSWMVRGDVVRDRAVRAVKRLRSPFFFWTHFSDPHEPYDAHGLVEHRAEIFLNGKLVAELPTSTYSVRGLDVRLPAGESELLVKSEYPFTVRGLYFVKNGATLPVLHHQLPPGPVAEHRALISSSESQDVTLAIGLADQVPLDDLQDRYAREVRFADDHVGALLDTLKANNFYEDSWIILTSDHGEGLGCHGIVGHVDNLYDCLVRIPLIVKPPRGSGFEPGTRRQDLASLVDLLPSLLRRMNVSIPEEATGRDLFAKGADRRSDLAIFLETHSPQAEETKYAARTAGEKIVWTPDSDRWELYDLRSDHLEQENLLEGISPETTPLYATLRTLLLEAQASTPRTVQFTRDAETREALRSLGYIN